MSGDEFRWADPPTRRHYVVKEVDYHNWDAIPAKLRTRPHTWAHVGSYTHGPTARPMVTRLKNGVQRNWTPGDYEVVSRIEQDGRTHIYARYIGDDEPATPSQTVDRPWSLAAHEDTA